MMDWLYNYLNSQQLHILATMTNVLFCESLIRL